MRLMMPTTSTYAQEIGDFQRAVQLRELDKRTNLSNEPLKMVIWSVDDSMMSR